MHDDTMSGHEWRSILSLAAIYSARMLGLFMILPVFSVYATHLAGATPFLIGVALGIYGLAQAGLQIPFGLLSDKVGRKRIILLGLVLFILGSVVAALSDSMMGVIIGRALQGMGAIGSTLTALLADLTREQYRTKAMTIIGMTIALSFVVAMIIGPFINVFVGVKGIFWLTAVLACGGIVVLWLGVPQPERHLFHRDAELTPVYLSEILKNKALLQQDLSIFMLHAILTATFIAIPLVIHQMPGFADKYHTFIYLFALLPAFILMVPFVIVAEKKRKMKRVYLLAIITILVSQGFLLFFHHTYLTIVSILFFFFTAFIVLEALIPSLVSKIAPAGRKGTALGIYSSLQFLGMFLGGTIGGVCLWFHSISGVFALGLILAIIWLGVALTMEAPRYVSSHSRRVGALSEEETLTLQQQLAQVDGVMDVYVDRQAQVAYLKIDRQQIDMSALDSLIKP